MLIKRKIFEKASPEMKQDTLDYIRHHDYELFTVIQKHLNRTLSMNDQLLSLQKFTILDTYAETTLKSSAPLKIAIHIHMHYDFLKQEFSNYLCNIQIPYDLYITTNSKSDSSSLEKHFMALKEFKMEQLTVLVTPNRGRDIAPLIVTLKDKIINYDLCCHLHSKHSPTISEGNIWRKYLLENLIGNEPGTLGFIIQLFERDPKLGFLFPPAWSFLFSRNTNLWGDIQNIKHCKSLLSKMHLKYQIKQSDMFPITSYGTMFWFRPKALEPILELGITYDDFEEEPIPSDGTLAHALERIFVLVGVSQGYDFRYALKYSISNQTIS